MVCSCGTEPDFNGGPHPYNGAFCGDCGVFTCDTCFAAFADSTTRFADRDLCRTCNAAPPDAERMFA